MAKLFNLKVLTPEKQFFDGAAESLTVTTTDGRFEFLADHVPTIMPLVVGTLLIKAPEGTIEVFNSEGFLEVRHDGVLVYIQACEKPDEINKQRAEDARLRAEEHLRQQQSMQEYQQSKMALARAMARLSVSRRDGFGGGNPPV
ncbi:F-type H+-transporting ATPase subunit epsilon [Sporobacter termitidis DSM 10068]|uniref:ATP synthase epsilon chain n=1 Tax=Sporobacter termitidis DSM 10068 TaxID=1123282 RepID=A0A1M5VUH9_9FIRM|nr:ATP synthase F1 subunit epsilon [Sporobacter termitidis]SHH78583.1 F-type H+-transporting ATPase subunit epsilon [Sporobacter termitidis DSM 10068]